MAHPPGPGTSSNMRRSVGPSRTQPQTGWRRSVVILLGVAALLAGAAPAGADVDVSDIRGVTTLPVDHSSQPATWDWRSHGVVTAVKDHGPCDSSWAFGITGLVEGYHAIQLGTLLSLSEQELVDCDAFGTACSGGRPVGSMRLMIANGGLAKESSYPYTAAPGACKSGSVTPAANIPGAGRVPAGDEQSLQAYVAAGPVLAMIDAGHSSFDNYVSGVYYEPACSTTHPTDVVLVVGYDTVGGVDYWIAKTSRGASWGASGYVLMARNRGNNCGIATYALAAANLPIRDAGPAIPALAPAALAGLAAILAALALVALARRGR